MSNTIRANLDRQIAADGLFAQSASNPVGLANSLVRSAKQVPGGTDAVRNHPGLRLMAYQLAWLFKVNELPVPAWVDLVKECEEMSGQTL